MNTVPSTLLYRYHYKTLFYCDGYDDYNRGADKSLARPTSPCILFDGENISFGASLVIEGVTGGTDQTSGGCSLC